MSQHAGSSEAEVGNGTEPAGKSRAGPSRRRVLLALPALVAGAFAARSLRRRAPLRVGILHSQSGTMAASERKVIDATHFAIHELNARGGVLGRHVEAVVADGASEPERFAHEAERLIVREGVCAIFGCWTSASRRATIPLIESSNHLLFYPMQYEGMERTRCVVYMNSVCNQQLEPAVRWARSVLGRRFYLLGSDYVFPRAAHAVMRGLLTRYRGEVVGESFPRLGTKDVKALVASIREARPDAILSTLNGDTNLAFFRALREAGLTAKKMPTVSFSLSEIEIEQLGEGMLEGDYTVWPYFQSLRSPQNLRFLRRYTEWTGRQQAIGSPMVSAYTGVHLWARAVELAGAEEPMRVREQVRGRSISGPGGMLYVDPDNLHTWQRMHIGQVRGAKHEVVWSSSIPIAPRPYPRERTPEEWDGLLEDLRRGWGGRWAPQE